MVCLFVSDPLAKTWAPHFGRPSSSRQEAKTGQWPLKSKQSVNKTRQLDDKWCPRKVAPRASLACVCDGRVSKPCVCRTQH